MGISQLRHLAAAGRTFDKAFFDKERLVNLFQRSGIFSQGSRDSRQSYRSAVKLVDDSRQQLIVDLIQAVTVDVQCLQSIAGNRLIDLSGSFHLCKITHTTQQRVRYTGWTTTAGKYFRIGEKKLRKLAEENIDAGWVIVNGNRIQIKRKQFEKIIDTLDEI